MDRLIIEATLEDVNEITLSENTNGMDSNQVLLFKAMNTDQIAHAFAELKKAIAQHPLDLFICKTMVHGIYDLELKTDGLDEPVRIMNKVISPDVLKHLEEQSATQPSLLIATDPVEQKSWLPIRSILIKDCESNSKPGL